MLLVFVEGYYDERFFASVFFENTSVQFVQYATLKPEKVEAFLKSIKQTPTLDYIFFGDGDGNSVNEKKNILTTKYKEIEQDKVFIVQYEIESWYYAGVRESDCKKLKLIKFEYLTNDLTKEDLDAKMIKPSEREYVLSKLLDFYTIELAEKRNDSLKLFSDYMRNSNYDN